MDLKPYVGALARSATLALGGVLVSKGVPPELVAKFVDPLNQALTGVILVAGATGWSLFQKHVFKKKILDSVRF